MKTIPLGGRVAAGRVALVDDEDYAIVRQYRWCAIRSHSTKTLYVVTNIVTQAGRTTLSMHKLITGYELTDHINHDGLDNRRVNLRPATSSQNVRNQVVKRNGASRYKGVGIHTLNGRWRARIQTDTGRLSLGMFATEAAAARAYDAAARKYHGEFAYLNFPDETTS